MCAPPGSLQEGWRDMTTGSVDLIGRYKGAMSGQACLVTGAGSGIGRAIARAFARSGAGIGLVGRQLKPLEETADTVRQLGRRALALPADVRDPQAVHEVTAQAAASLGPIAGAVTGAGVNAWTDLRHLEPQLLRNALTTNVEGVANVARAAVPAMVQRGQGKLLIVASDNGRRPEAEGSGYVASKFAAVGFGLSLSRELMHTGVNVHIIEPGPVDTPWYRDDEEAPREKMLRPDDVALACLFLATLPSHIVLEELMLLPRDLESAV